MSEELTGLLAIQSELKVPKNRENTFGGYHYRSAEDILDAVKPLLVKYNCTLYLTDGVEAIGGYLYVFSDSVFTDSSGKETKVRGYARETMEKKKYDSSQLTGSASSYARKYSLNGLFLLDDVKDSDETNTGSENKTGNPSIPDNKWMEFYQQWNGESDNNVVEWNGNKYELNQKQVEYVKRFPKVAGQNKNSQQQ